MGIFDIVKNLFNIDTSVGAFFTPVFIAIVTIIVAHIFNYILKRVFQSSERALDRHAEQAQDVYHKEKIAAEKTKFVFMRRAFVGIIYIIGIILIVGSIPSLRTFSTSLLAGAGVAAIIIGFATQKTLSNIISGLMISVSQPFRIGDRVRFREDYGTIKDITLRHTVLLTWDNRHVIIPNSIVNDEIINNYTLGDEKILATVEIDISYDSDIDLARKIMLEEITMHPYFVDNRSHTDLLAHTDPAKIRTVACEDFSIKLRGYYWVSNQPHAILSRFDLIESIKKRFDREGVEIPYPYRTLVYKKDMKKTHRLKREKIKSRAAASGKKRSKKKSKKKKKK